MSKEKRKKEETTAPAIAPAGASEDSVETTPGKKARKAAERAAEKAAEAAKEAEREARRLSKKAAKEEKKREKKNGAKNGKKGDEHADDAKTSLDASSESSSESASESTSESPSESSSPKFKHVRKKKLSSGKGATPQEVGASLVALFNAGKSEEAEQTWYHRKIESIEEDGSVFEGWKGVLEKGKWWKENFTVLSMRASGPYVCSNGFTVVYTGRVRMPDGTEVDAHECGVYTVEKGRIVREQFMQWRG